MLRRPRLASPRAVVVVENNNRIRAVGVGRAVITGNYRDGSGEDATLTIDVTSCSDAGTDG